jgi:iron complex outermembrane receptor protein
MRKQAWCLLALLAAVPAFAADPGPQGDATLDEMLVTATRTEQSLQDSPASVDVVRKKDFGKRDVKTLDQAVNMLPGVLVRRSKGLSDTLSAITLRGIPDQKRTLVMMDGITMNNAYDGSINIAGMNPEDIERVEVVRGPFSSLYGGPAMGGVVNFISRMPDRREFTFKTGYGDAWERHEAPGELYTISGSYGDRFGKLRMYTSLSYKTTDGYVTDRILVSSAPPAGISGYYGTTSPAGATRYAIGDRGDNGWWDFSGKVKLLYEISPDSSLQLSYIRTDYKYRYNNPNSYLDNAATGEPVWSYGTSVREKTFLGGVGSKPQNIYSMVYETVIRDVKAKVNASVNDTPGWYTEPATGATRGGGPGSLSDNRMVAYAVDTQASVPILEKHILTVGAAYREDRANPKEYDLSDFRDEDSKEGLTYEAKGRNVTWSLFTQGEIALHPRLTGYIGFREDWWSTHDGYANQVGDAGYPQDYASRSKSSFSPKAALVYRPLDSTTLRGSIGRAFRSPGIYDLYRTWSSTSGTKTTIYQSNPDLDPETVVSYDLGVEQKLWKKSKFRATYFRNDLKDMIYSTTISDTATEAIKKPMNVGRAKSQGIELDFENRSSELVGFYVSYTYTDSEVTENEANPAAVGCRLINVPSTMFNAGIDLSLKPVTVNLSGRYVGKRYTSDANTDVVNNVYTSRDPYFVADAKAAYQFTDWGNVSLSVSNIFNRQYYDYYVAPGRAWYTEVALNF